MVNGRNLVRASPKQLWWLKTLNAFKNEHEGYLNIRIFTYIDYANMLIWILSAAFPAFSSIWVGNWPSQKVTSPRSSRRPSGRAGHGVHGALSLFREPQAAVYGISLWRQAPPKPFQLCFFCLSFYINESVRLYLPPPPKKVAEFLKTETCVCHIHVYILYTGG